MWLHQSVDAVLHRLHTTFVRCLWGRCLAGISLKNLKNPEGTCNVLGGFNHDITISNNASPCITTILTMRNSDRTDFTLIELLYESTMHHWTVAPPGFTPFNCLGQCHALPSSPQQGTARSSQFVTTRCALRSLDNFELSASFSGCLHIAVVATMFPEDSACKPMIIAASSKILMILKNQRICYNQNQR